MANFVFILLIVTGSICCAKIAVINMISGLLPECCNFENKKLLFDTFFPVSKTFSMCFAYHVRHA